MNSFHSHQGLRLGVQEPEGCSEILSTALNTMAVQVILTELHTQR